MKRNLAKLVTLCAALALCLSVMLCFSLTTSADAELLPDGNVSEEISEAVLAELSEEAIAQEILYGDADGDGELTMKDVLTIRKYVVGMEVEIDLEAADADGDGEITMKDARLVCRTICRGGNADGECGGQGRGHRGECSGIGGCSGVGECGGSCGGQGRGEGQGCGGQGRGQGRGECGGCSELTVE